MKKKQNECEKPKESVAITTEYLDILLESDKKDRECFLEKMDVIIELLKRYDSIDRLVEQIDLFEKQCWLLKEVLTVHEAAALLDVTTSTIYHYTSTNVVPFYKSHGSLFFKKDELIAYLTRHRFMSHDEIVENAKRVVEELKRPKFRMPERSGSRPKSRGPYKKRHDY